MVRLVLCCLNAKYVHASPAPYALAAAVAGIPGLDTVVVDGTVNQPPEDVLARLLDKGPDVVGFSCTIWSLVRVAELTARLRAAGYQGFVVWGGPEVAPRGPEILRQYPAVDFVLAGEGEFHLPALLAALPARAWHTVPGLTWREGRTEDGQPILRTQPPLQPADDPPEPLGYLSALDGRIAYVETSRGCPFRCAFCLSGGQTVRHFDEERARRQLVALAQSGTRTVKLVDRTFNANPRRALSFWRFLLTCGEIPAGVCFHFEVAGDLLDAESLALLCTAPPGRFQLEIGVQSLHSPTLAAIGRQCDVSRLRESVAYLRQNSHVHLHLDLIAGLPYEGIAEFEKSFNQTFALRPQMLQLGFLKLLHGSGMESLAAGWPDYRFASLPPYAVLETPWLSAEELNTLRQFEDVFNALYNKGRFQTTLEYLLDGVTPFSFFLEFTQLTGGLPPKMSLDELSARLYDWAAPRVPSAAHLRALMRADRAAAGVVGRLPRFLRER